MPTPTGNPSNGNLSNGNPSAFERMIAEAFAARKAGVFAPTPVDAVSLVAAGKRSRTVRWHQRVLVGLPVAACFAAVLGLAVMWGLDSERGSSPFASLQPTVAHGAEFDARLVVGCMSGPGERVTNGCTAADLDDDGDVDLHDLSAFQRRVAN